MHRKCCIPGCNSSSKRKIVMHKMPAASEKVMLWHKTMSAAPFTIFEGRTWVEIGKLYVCHNHFEAKYVSSKGILKPNASPTLFTPEEITRGTPANTSDETGSIELRSPGKQDHSYARKCHYDHSYAMSKSVPHADSGSSYSRAVAHSAGASSALHTGQASVSVTEPSIESTPANPDSIVAPQAQNTRTKLQGSSKWLNEGGEECGICSLCVGRLRDAIAFKLQVQRSQAELEARMERALQAIDSDEELVFKLEVEDSDTEPAVKAEVGGDDGTCEDFVLHSEPAVESEASGDAASDDCASLARGGAGAGLSESEPARPVSARAREQLAMACSVRLERLRGDEAPHASQTCLATSRRGPRLASRMKDTPDDTAGLRAEEQAYTCDTCGEHFTRSSTLIKHIRDHATGAGAGAEAPHCCRICSEHFSSKRALVVHKRTHKTVKPYSCEICNKEFTTEPALVKHTVTHSGPRPYGCDVCHKQFKSKYYLKTHKMIHTYKPYTCDICDQQFTQKSLLIGHITTHTGEKPYTCDVCSKTLSHISALNRHQRIHAGERYACNICDKQFTRKGNLVTHMRTHTGERPYTCVVCDKTFTDVSALRQHERIHTGERNTCNICDKQFTRKSYLIMHIRTHTGERPYTCDVCGKTFTFSSSLRKHQPIHTGKCYACNNCDKQFTHKSYLITHMRIHTGERPYTCDVCNKTFVHRSALRKHQWIHTGKS